MKTTEQNLLDITAIVSTLVEQVQILTINQKNLIKRATELERRLKAQDALNEKYVGMFEKLFELTK